MGLKLIIAPGIGSPTLGPAEPLLLAAMITHLREFSSIPSDAQTQIEGLITAAREYAENFCSRAFLTQTWDLVLDAFPAGVLELPKAPLQSIESVKYIDSDGAEQTLAASAYKVDAVTDPGRIAPAYGTIWPVTRAEPNAVTIRFIAGYGDAAESVPQAIKHAITLMVGHLYANREAVQSEGDFYRLPLGVEALLSPYRTVRWD